MENCKSLLKVSPTVLQHNSLTAKVLRFKFEGNVSMMGCGASVGKETKPAARDRSEEGDSHLDFRFLGSLFQKENIVVIFS